MQIEPSTAGTAGIVLLTVATIAYGGTFMLRVVTGAQATNELQKSFFRAGHAHAGVLVMLGLIVQLYVDLAGVDDLARRLSILVLVAAILMPAGFFFSVIGRDPQAPNRWSLLIWLGAACLTVGVVASGIGLLAVS